MKLLLDRRVRTAVYAIRIGRTRTDNPARVRNFVRINYGLTLTPAQAEEAWYNLGPGKVRLAQLLTPDSKTTYGWNIPARGAK